MICRKCDKEVKPDCFWDESGYGYSAKIIRCPNCGAIKYLKVIEDFCLDINNNERFYEYENI